VFVDGKSYKTTQGLGKYKRPDKNLISNQDKQVFKQILLQSNAHWMNNSPSGKNKKQTNAVYFATVYKHKGSAWESLS